MRIKIKKNKMDKTNKLTTGVIISLIILSILSLALAYFTKLSNIESFRIIFGSIYVLFLPGFILSYAFFPKTKSMDDKASEQNKDDIDWLERIALSFALSIAIVPLAVFYLNLIGVKINLLNSFLTIFGIIVISFITLWFRLKKTNNSL